MKTITVLYKRTLSWNSDTFYPRYPIFICNRVNKSRRSSILYDIDTKLWKKEI